ESPGSRSASHCGLGSSARSTSGPVVVPPRGRISSAAVNGQLNVYCRTCSSAHAETATRLAASTPHHSAHFLSVIGVLRRLEPRVVRPADPSCERQLHGEIER